MALNQTGFQDGDVVNCSGRGARNALYQNGNEIKKSIKMAVSCIRVPNVFKRRRTSH